MDKRCGRCGVTKPVSEFYVRKNPGGWDSSCKSCRSDISRERRVRRGPEWARDEGLRKRFGITLAQYDALLISQEGRCAACGALAEGRELHVDHDHACCPGRRSCGQCVRALLCPPCNQALGLFQDDPALLLAAAAYLEPSDD